MNKKILITGGAGFIGTNVASTFAKNGHEVIVFDNLSRKGTKLNIDWLQDSYANLSLFLGDIRNMKDFEKCFQVHGQFDVVFHFAAQVAVTTSVVDPREDFEINALGSFNLLEAIRKYNQEAIVIYSSTNKVFGELSDYLVVERNNRYEYKDYPTGIPENTHLDFHSPYGCSKGCADQYFIDYNRIYGIKSIIFRQSCIYGYRQFGIEDQGWVAWFTIASLYNKNISIYGDGKQVRDVLFIEDLVRAYELAIENSDKTIGNAYNMGGSTFNMSLLELLKYLEEFLGKKINYTFDEWRPGDQKVFIADCSKARKDFGWQPEIDVRTGVKKLVSWVEENKKIFQDVGLV